MRGARATAFLLLALLVAACDDEPAQEAEARPRPVKVFRVADADLVAGRTFPGQARSAREATLGFRISGRIQERRVKTGDQVKQGDVLAVLDAAPYQAELDRATANLKRAQSAYENAASQLERDKQLFARGVVAKARIESSEATADQTRAEVKSLEAAQERARLDLAYAELRAPFSGIVSAVFAESFEEVKPQQSIVRLIDPREIEMIVNVPESLISYVPHVVDLKATFDALSGIEIPAEISEIGTEPSENSRTYRVKLLLTPPNGVAIVPGMAGRVRGRPGPGIIEKFKGVVVPLSSVFSPDDAKGSFVWTVNEQTKTVHRKAVTLGEPVVGGVNVTSGLAAGSLVVAAGVYSLKEGQTVRVLESEVSAAR